jgi:hypothetical protein
VFNLLTHPINFPCGRKPGGAPRENPSTLTIGRALVDRLISHKWATRELNPRSHKWMADVQWRSYQFRVLLNRVWSCTCCGLKCSRCIKTWKSVIWRCKQSEGQCLNYSYIVIIQFFSMICCIGSRCRPVAVPNRKVSNMVFYFSSTSAENHVALLLTLPSLKFASNNLNHK